MKKFFQEFKEFALKGNVMDLAVGVIIGAAFQGVVKSLTDNILNPILGKFTSGESSLAGWVVWELQIGAFIMSIIDFLIMAFVIFLIVKGMNNLTTIGEKHKHAEPVEEEAPAPEPRKCPYCMSEVDELATRCPACTSQLAAES